MGAAALDRRAGVFDLLGNASEWVLDAWDPLAYCDAASRAIFSASRSAPTAFPRRVDVAGLDAMCAERPGCLAACDDDRLDCLAACEQCRRADSGGYGDCLVETRCLFRCAVPLECACAAGDAPGCESSCACHAACHAESAPVAEAPDRFLAGCYANAEADCRASGCLAPGCRTYCGELGAESNRLCHVREADGRPVEVPVVTEHPPGLADLFVVKGGAFTTRAEDACALRVGARRPQAGTSPTVGFRCADGPAQQ